MIASNPTPKTIHQDAFLIGAALTGVRDLSRMDFMIAIASMPDKHRRAILNETREALVLLRELEGVLSDYR